MRTARMRGDTVARKRPESLIEEALAISMPFCWSRTTKR
jgi:hypothetical protein